MDKTEEKEIVRGSSVHWYIQSMNNEQLMQCIDELNNVTWSEDALLRKAALMVHGNDTVLHMLTIAKPLAEELLYRVRSSSI